MTAPAAPNVVLNPYYRTDGTVSFNFITTPDVQGADIDIYDSDSTLVYTGAASGTQDLWSETWTLDVPVVYFGTAGETYDVSVHVFNDDGDAYATTSFAVSDPPTVTLLPAEGATITGLPLTILWTVTDPTGVSKQVLRVSGASSMVYASDYSPATALDTDARSIVLDSSNMLNMPADGETYSVRISVTNGVGFLTTVTHSVSVSWLPPATPTATVTTDPATLAASVTVTAGAGTPATDTLMVVRVSPDGTRYVLADDLESGDTVTDPLPPLGVAYTYEVTGIAATGVPSAPATVTQTNVTTCWALNFGESAGEAMLLYGNPRETYGLDQGGTAYHFADGGAGRGLPVWYGTTDRDISGTTSFDTVLWHEADRLQELCDQHDLGWLRDPHGHRRRAHMSPKVSHGVGEVWQVTVSWDEMRWEEPTNG